MSLTVTKADSSRQATKTADFIAFDRGGDLFSTVERRLSIQTPF